MRESRIRWILHQEHRIARRLELLRGYIARWHGATAGRHFGLGQNVRLIYPMGFTAGDDVTIGDYSYLHCLSKIGVRIGSNTSIERNLWLHCGGRAGDFEHGWFEIGANSFIGCNAVLGAGGGIRIGDHVLIGQSVNMHAENHCFADASQRIDQQGVSYSGITIEDDVWIGSTAVILDGVTIGKGAVIGAGAVVTRSIPAYSIAVGSPARVIRQRHTQQNEDSTFPQST
jgi:acetyltransferase-like isoleucine patch superfamily enzyme